MKKLQQFTVLYFSLLLFFSLTSCSTSKMNRESCLIEKSGRSVAQMSSCKDVFLRTSDKSEETEIVVVEGYKSLRKNSEQENVKEPFLHTELAEIYPKLAERIKVLGENIVVEKQISHPREIPFESSNGFRFAKAETMVSRADELPVELSNTIQAVYNILNNKKELTIYFQKLFAEAALRMAYQKKEGDVELLEQGFVTMQSINAVIVKRFKAREDLGFTTLTQNKGLKFGNRELRVKDRKTGNDNFRAAVAEGPFFDMNFDPWSRGGHGAFTHMIQRDITHMVVYENMEGKSQQFWSYLGTRKGINWWADLFDAGSVKSFNRPERLTQYIMHELGKK